MEHHAALAYADAYASRVGICGAPAGSLEPGSTLLVASHFTFDPSIGDVLTGLCHGACVALTPWAVLTQAMMSAMRVLRPSHVLSTPSIWELGVGSEASSVAGLPASVRVVALTRCVCRAA